MSERRQWYYLILFCLISVSFLYVRFVVLPESLQIEGVDQKTREQVIMQMRRELAITSTQEPVFDVIDDIALLRISNPQFYQEVNNGDWSFRFSDRLVIYRPSTQQIVKVQK